jgi:hypothetical protein
MSSLSNFPNSHQQKPRCLSVAAAASYLSSLCLCRQLGERSFPPSNNKTQIQDQLSPPQQPCKQAIIHHHHHHYHVAANDS